MKKLFILVNVILGITICGATSNNVESTSEVKHQLFNSPNHWYKAHKGYSIDKDGKITIKTDKANSRLTALGSIIINPKFKYTISAKVRSLPNTGETLFFIGFLPQNSKSKIINAETVNGNVNTLTNLVFDAKKGDNKLIVKDASKWSKKKNQIVAFNADKSLADLPNTQLSSTITNITPKDGAWQITLSKPLTKTYPATTTVRNHALGATYIYAIIGKSTQEWKTFTGTIEGISDCGIKSYMWWPTTYKANLILFAATNKIANVEIKDIKISIE